MYNMFMFKCEINLQFLTHNIENWGNKQRKLAIESFYLQFPLLAVYFLLGVVDE